MLFDENYYRFPDEILPFTALLLENDLISVEIPFDKRRN